MPLFLDACALAKRYLPEYGSKRMREITGRSEPWGGFVVSGFIEPEVLSALAKHVRDPKYAPDARNRYPVLVNALRRELDRTAFTILSVTDDVVERAADLLRRKPEYEIHAGDAVHLATALAFRAKMEATDTLVFVTTDRGLEAAARTEGLKTFNPLRENIGTLRMIPGLYRS
jgi:predicted nucleic acid-binding protein